MYEVENDIPIPDARHSADKRAKWPELKVGQSFVVGSERDANSALVYMRNVLGQKPMRRKVGDDTYRIWRVE